MLLLFFVFFLVLYHLFKITIMIIKNRESMKFKSFFQSETCLIAALLTTKTALYISYLLCDQVKIIILYHFV